MARARRWCLFATETSLSRDCLSDATINHPAWLPFVCSGFEWGMNQKNAHGG